MQPHHSPPPPGPPWAPNGTPPAPRGWAPAAGPSMHYEVVVPAPPLPARPDQPPVTWGQSLGLARRAVDWRSVPWFRWLTMALWLLLGIAASVPLATLTTGDDSADSSDFSYTVRGWQTMLVVLAFILLVATAVAGWLTAVLVPRRVPAGFILAGLIVLAVVLTLVEVLMMLMTSTPGDLFEIHFGLGGWLTIVVVALMVLAAVFEVRAALRAPRPMTPPAPFRPYQG